jgi:hypothetical protein
MDMQDTNANLNEIDYTEDEFMKQADISSTTLRRWIERGLISPDTHTHQLKDPGSMSSSHAGGAGLN